MLIQRAVDDGMYHPCNYYSRLTNQAEQNYHSFELETLAVVESLKKFRSYLLGQKFKVITDCFAFKQSMAKKIPNARVSRWMVVLAELEFEVEHRSAERMQHVDALSRASVMSVSTVICERMRKEQQRDPKLAAILSKFSSGEEIDDYFAKDGVLYKGDVFSSRLCVPISMEAEVIKNAHD